MIVPLISCSTIKTWLQMSRSTSSTSSSSSSYLTAAFTNYYRKAQSFALVHSHTNDDDDHDVYLWSSSWYQQQVDTLARYCTLCAIFATDITYQSYTLECWWSIVVSCLTSNTQNQWPTVRTFISVKRRPNFDWKMEVGINSKIKFFG